MKALVLAAALAALSSAAPAGAVRDARPQAVTDTATAAVIADAGRLGSASLTALNGGSHWTPPQHSGRDESPFELPLPDVDAGSLLLGITVLVMALSRPVSRLLRRQEQQRRATALASTLGQAPRH